MLRLHRYLPHEACADAKDGAADGAVNAPGEEPQHQAMTPPTPTRRAFRRWSRKTTARQPGAPAAGAAAATAAAATAAAATATAGAAAAPLLLQPYSNGRATEYLKVR